MDQHQLAIVIAVIAAVVVIAVIASPHIFL
jgi:hypothetical protein